MCVAVWISNVGVKGSTEIFFLVYEKQVFFFISTLRDMILVDMPERCAKTEKFRCVIER